MDSTRVAKGMVLGAGEGAMDPVVLGAGEGVMDPKVFVFQKN